VSAPFRRPALHSPSQPSPRLASNLSMLELTLTRNLYGTVGSNIDLLAGSNLRHAAYPAPTRTYLKRTP